MGRLDRRSILVRLVFLALIGTACNRMIPHFGIGGHYEEGREEFLRGRSGNMDTAVKALEAVVAEDPTYKFSLTYLGRAYYNKGRYQDAFAILQRAVAIRNDDEMAWIALGLTQMRLGQIDKGVESLKGGITLASKVMVDGYHNYLYWDTRGLIRAAMRRSAFLVAKGVDERNSIIQETDRMMLIIDDEDNFQRNTRIQNNRPLYGG